MLGTLVQVFRGGLFGVWALKVGQELDPDRGRSRKDKR